ncbi:hypothetical protein BRC80_11100 [Halobacteriales archaeon QH_9_66_26]|nr:MAG: hypothetical protein BRC80_11100 [Halobacteriales archaeon QH_9_66_26]
MSGIVRERWTQFLCALLGLWLMVAPAVLGYDEPLSTVHRIIGPMVAAVGIVALWGHLHALSRWLHPPLGVLLVIVPPLLGVLGIRIETVALVNSLVVGPALLVLGVLGGRVTERYGGGWSSLWTGDVFRGSADDNRR